MASTYSKHLPILIAGGGIGGLATALALARQGYRVKVMEQSPRIGEIGAGIQLGPNAFAAFDALGVGELARAHAVYPERLVMMDALDGSEVASLPLGEAFGKRFGNPYGSVALATDKRDFGRDECHFLKLDGFALPMHKTARQKTA